MGKACITLVELSNIHCFSLSTLQFNNLLKVIAQSEYKSLILN